MRQGLFSYAFQIDSITYTQSGFRILDNGHVWLSKIGEVRMFMHRPINETIKTLSIKRDKVGDWFITITADEKENNQPFEQEDHGPIIKGVEFRSPIGIDLGLKALIMTSNDRQIEPPAFLMNSEKKLKKAQRILSRKKNRSGKRTKAKTGVAKIHRKIERQRDDFTHKLSNKLVMMSALRPRSIPMGLLNSISSFMTPFIIGP